MFKVIADKLLPHSRLIAFLSGWLAVSALPPFNIFPALFISFSLLLLLIDNSDSPARAFKHGYFFGFAYFAFGLSWIINALLLEIAAFWWLIPIVFFASGLFFGLFIALPAYLCRFFKTSLARWLAFASLITIFEWIRSFFLTGFPWNLFGTTLTFSNTLIQAASLGGVYLLSLSVVLACSTPFLWLRGYRLTAPIIFAVITSALCGFGAYQINAHPYKSSATTIRIVQPSIPQTLKWNPAVLQDNLDRHIKMSQLSGFENIDFVVWSETAFPYALELDTYHRGQLQYAIPPHGNLITGALRYEPTGTDNYNVYNSMFVLNHQNEITSFYDKTHLVPFGEYIPLRRYLPEWIKPVANTIGTFSVGSGAKVIKSDPAPSLGGLICYEVIFPHQILNPANKPNWIVNITNDGWYGNSAGPWQHLASARLRAIEEGITIVRAAGSGISALISPIGEIVAQIPLQKSGIIDVKLPQQTDFSTIYGRYGNIIPLGICLFLIVAALSCSRSFSDS